MESPYKVFCEDVVPQFEKRCKFAFPQAKSCNLKGYMPPYLF